MPLPPRPWSLEKRVASLSATAYKRDDGWMAAHLSTSLILKEKNCVSFSPTFMNGHPSLYPLPDRGGVSLSLERAYVCWESYFISFSFREKWEIWSRKGHKRGRRFESLFGWKRFLLRETTLLDVTERVIAFYSRRDGEFARRFRRDFESLGFSLF